MLAAFCLRLALGLLASLLLLSPEQLHPRFFRTHFLTALGLCVVATWSAWPDASAAGQITLSVAALVALLGALSWMLEPPPLGRSVVVLSIVAIVGGLVVTAPLTH